MLAWPRPRGSKYHEKERRLYLMTADEQREEGAEEPIEDLQAPAESLHHITGGDHVCTKPTCHGKTDYMGYCLGATCRDTVNVCVGVGSKSIIVGEA
jgi:hypothetical protein